jgi:DNA invertase Pin-like site-specific DNA recombinase
LYTIIKIIAEFEKLLKRERRREGAIPKIEKPIFKGGSQKILTSDQIGLLKHQVLLGARKTDIAKSLGITTATVYNYLKIIDD